MKLNVYEDGDKVNEVEVNVNDVESIMKQLDEQFDCGQLKLDEIEMEISDGEVYIGISEVQYFWNL